MAVNLQITLGTVNYTDFLHVTAAKVSAPNITVWQTWINVPVANYNFVITGLDPDDYYISFYDSPDNVSLGQFIGKCFVNAKTNEYQYEIRFYEIGNLPNGVTINPQKTILNDPYLIDKTVENTFKESFRFLRPTIEYNFNNGNGDVSLVTGNFQDGEVFCLTIKYATGTVSSSSSGLYSGTLTVTEATKILIAADRNKRIRLKGNAATQVITVATLASLNETDGFYFDNSCGGTAVQVKLVMQGMDRINFNGFMSASNEFAEFWVSKGEHLLIKKFIDENNNEFFEVITDYKGIHVGERYAASFKNMPGCLAEDGALRDGDEYGRPWWWINEYLPSTHLITDDAVINPNYVHPKGKEGLFVKHSVLKKFRMPNTQNLSERGLKNFNNYGIDPKRVYDYPGGFQEQEILEHDHFMFGGPDNGGAPYAATGHSTGGNLGYGIWGTTGVPNSFKTGKAGGSENIVKNIGVIYVRRI